MKSRWLGVVALFAVAPHTAGAETTWEASVLRGPGRQLLAKGAKTYDPTKDIVVQEQPPGKDGSPSWTKSLRLDETFALSAAVTRESELDGFGLVIYRRGDANGFSWEWFDREKDGTFGKRQDSGRLAITKKKGPGYEELESIEFLEDTTLRYLDDMSKPPGTHTHEVIIRKGSVFTVRR
jgi:hypothetical protein